MDLEKQDRNKHSVSPGYYPYMEDRCRRNGHKEGEHVLIRTKVAESNGTTT